MSITEYTLDPSLRIVSNVNWLSRVTPSFVSSSIDIVRASDDCNWDDFSEGEVAESEDPVENEDFADKKDSADKWRYGWKRRFCRKRRFSDDNKGFAESEAFVDEFAEDDIFSDNEDVADKEDDGNWLHWMTWSRVWG